MNGIEPLDVADLENAAVLPGELNEFASLFGVVGHRLLDEDVLALKQELLREIEVRDGGRDDAEGVRCSGGFGDGSEGARAEFLGDTAGGLGGDIEEAGELYKSGLRQFAVDAGVFLAERAGAKDGDAKFMGGWFRGVCHGRRLPLSGREAQSSNFKVQRNFHARDAGGRFHHILGT